MKTTPFWIVDRNQLIIDEHRLVNFLQEFGFATFRTSVDKIEDPQLIYKNGNIIEPISPMWVHLMVIKSIDVGLLEESIKSEVIKGALISELISSKILTKKEVLNLVNELDNKKIISDTKDTSYFFFKKSAVLVTKERIEIVPIESLDKYIWKSQIIEKELNLKDLNKVQEYSDYYKFLGKITSINPKVEEDFNKERFDNLFTLQGYLLHSYKDRVNAKAVALMDASEIGEPNGRTGKSLFVNGLSKLKKTILEDGKSFKDDNRFRFSQVTSDTKILFINDVRENFNFENFFPTITDGITVEVKFENKRTIPFEDSPKVVISTNYAILGRGSSFEDRIYEFELSNHYSNNHRPINDFKHRLFDEWDTDQWDLFYSLMLYSVQAYLRRGVVISEGINLNRNKLIAETSKQFVEWITAFDVKPNTKYVKKALYKDFCDFVGISTFINNISQLIFTKYLKSWARYNNLNSIEGHSNLNRTIEFQSR